MKNYFFTSESVTEGHPDKLADLISDRILDEAVKKDKNARVAVETFVSDNVVTIAGQITLNEKLPINIAKNIVANGYAEKSEIQ